MGQPHGLVVGFGTLHFGSTSSWVWILDTDLCHRSAMLWWQPICKIEEDWHRYLLTDNLPQVKRGRLATDVTSWPIFLKKKKKVKDDFFCIAFSRQKSQRSPLLAFSLPLFSLSIIIEARSPLFSKDVADKLMSIFFAHQFNVSVKVSHTQKLKF